METKTEIKERLKKIKLTDFYNQEELDKWDIVFYKEVWFLDTDIAPNSSDVITLSETKRVQIIRMEEDELCYFFKTIDL